MDEKKNTVRAAERALDILLCFTNNAELGLTEIARETGLNKSTVFRLLATLEGKGFIKRDLRSDKYQLGIRIWELAGQIYQSSDPAMLFIPEMELLRDTLDETVSLYIQDGTERIRVQAVESNQAIRRVAPIGVRMPIIVGASGKVFMAFLPKNDRNRLLAQSGMSEQEIQDYERQLEDIKQNGYALSVEERETGTAAISVPVFHRDGHLLAALAVSGPVSRMSVDQMSTFVPSLKQAAEHCKQIAK
ncbi:IclR family transcriptional regulator [Shimazuella alba]|jgi:DNA-binding IclR family transcriptional regulator|uniref:Glycerol operon regulatory protein n=1 Tax=Shimazuella alba TaxID=2690964 RepID=A0A6I4VQG0_9BACL|nr:IclR family transcriptional regulator [Shimazuella alba]MXQ53887.1 helix-turn-helix domain-containing protein [Shimazuella alba]